MISSSAESQKWMLGITPWSWPTRWPKRNKDAPSSWSSMARTLCSSSLLELPDAVAHEAVLLTVDVFLYSASSYNWEGGGGGYGCVPVRQQPHPQVHSSGKSNTCTDRVAVDAQKGLSTGLPVSQPDRERERERERESFLLCIHSVHLFLGHSLSTGCCFRRGNSCFRDVDKKQEKRQWEHTLTRCRSADVIHAPHNVHF